MKHMQTHLQQVQEYGRDAQKYNQVKHIPRAVRKAHSPMIPKNKIIDMKQSHANWPADLELSRR